MTPKHTRHGKGSRHIVIINPDLVEQSKAQAEKQDKSWYLWLEEAIKEKLERSK